MPTLTARIRLIEQQARERQDGIHRNLPIEQADTAPNPGCSAMSNTGNFRPI
jgi:hypothetical protein